MCGIVGICFAKNQAQLTAVSSMRDALTHRGPDDAGIWIDDHLGVALGHRRLSILDLSAHGHQPMRSSTGRYMIVFNGEIYNFRELRAQLEKITDIKLIGHSDTEVLLAAIETYGFHQAIQLAVGMFAIALWDRQDQALYLARDRFGEKPLYYSWIGQTLIFASELKAFKRFPDFGAVINKEMIGVYLKYNYIPAPYSIYEGAYKILPGKYLKINARGEQHEETYWSAKGIAQQGILSPTQLSFSEATDQLESTLKETIALQMVADVPVGAFLSGGIDSSLIVALMQAQASSPVKTFSVGFEEESFNEAPYAKKIAAHLGTDHTELYMTPTHWKEALNNFSILYDEPFADPSQLPTFLVSKLAREKVKVSLSGDGGDELFGGYQRYWYAQQLWNVCKFFPTPLRKTIGRLSNAAFKILPDFLQQSAQLRKLGKYAKLLKDAEEKYDYYFSLLSVNPNPWLNQGLNKSEIFYENRDEWLQANNFLEWMLFFDTVVYLPDDILTKLDRATMAISLEGRIPFLDHRIYEFAWQLPIHYKVEQGQGKKILRSMLNRYIPKSLRDRPKHGFGFPLGKWIRGPLKPLFDEAFSHEQQLSEYFNVKYIQEAWKKAGDVPDHTLDATFWAIFVFAQWLEDV